MSNTPAFPLNTPKWHESVSDAGFQDIDFTMGMTLRDYFAAKALPICYQYWMGDYYHPDCPDAEERNAEGRDDFDSNMRKLIAEDSYSIADAMLKAREA